MKKKSRKSLRQPNHFKDTLVNAIVQLEKAKKLLNEGKLSEAQAIDWESMCAQLKRIS